MYMYMYIYIYIRYPLPSLANTFDRSAVSEESHECRHSKRRQPSIAKPTPKGLLAQPPLPRAPTLAKPFWVKQLRAHCKRRWDVGENDRMADGCKPSSR